MKSIARGILLGSLLLTTAWPQPVPNPPFTINRKITMAQANRGGRVELDYDLTGWPVKSMTVTCYRYEGVKGTTAVRSWTYARGKGRDRLDFKKMPTAVYVFTCELTDANDRPMALNFRPVQLEYGGWSGRLRNEEAAKAAGANPNLPLGPMPDENDTSAEWVFKVSPDALVVKPGTQATLTASLNSRPVAEPLEWRLEGPGKIMVVENFVCYYLANPKTPSGERAVIRVFAPQHPQLKQEIQVLVSTEAVVAPTTSE